MTEETVRLIICLLLAVEILKLFYHNLNHNQYMGRLQDVLNKLNKLEEAVAAEHEQVSAAVAELKEEIKTLREKIQDGTPEEIDAILNRTDEIIEKVQNIYEPENNEGSDVVIDDTPANDTDDGSSVVVNED